MSRQTWVEEERNSDFFGNLTKKNGIDGGGVVEDTSQSAVEIPILERYTSNRMSLECCLIAGQETFGE
jgi:hypothetical protein